MARRRFTSNRDSQRSGRNRAAAARPERDGGKAGRQDVYGAGEAIQAASGVSRAYQAVPRDGDQERGQPD
ncbi:hypothetical protein T261_0291 [Streptomyces lydicus]|nr:hypothetical protein T261_0291 [Streptomyces lydicus]